MPVRTIGQPADSFFRAVNKMLVDSQSSSLLDSRSLLHLRKRSRSHHGGEGNLFDTNWFNGTFVSSWHEWWRQIHFLGPAPMATRFQISRSTAVFMSKINLSRRAKWWLFISTNLCVLGSFLVFPTTEPRRLTLDQLLQHLSNAIFPGSE